MSEMMDFPADWQEFVQQYQFADREETYTNGAMLIPSYRVSQMVEHYFYEKNPDGLPVGLTITENGELLNWRGENYVRQRDSFAKMEQECAELRRMLADAAEAI